MNKHFKLLCMALMGTAVLMGQTPHALEKITEGVNDYWVLDTTADLIWLADDADLDADNDNTDDFADLATKMTANYRLGATIIFATDETTVDWNNDGTVDANDAAGLLSIGTSNKFKGHFDGRYHSIQNAFQNASSIGLFNQVNGATIEKLGLLDFDFISDSPLGGGIVGEATGSGNVFHQLLVEGSLDFSSAENTNVYVGGVVGLMTNVTVTECLAIVDYTGKISTSKGKKAGGLIGQDKGNSTITDSYAVATLDGGKAYIAGLIGKSSNTDGTLSITNCYAASTVSNVADANTFGGFAGDLTSAAVASSYWDSDMQTEGVGAGDNAGDVSGLVTSAFATFSNFVGWDFTNTWEVGTVDNAARPVLQWEQKLEPPVVAFNSTSSNGLESVSTADLQLDLSYAADVEVTIAYAVTGTATGSGTDYTLADGTLTITAGATSGTVTIANIIDDAEAEGNETIILTLSSPVNATLGTHTVHTYTISNNDVNPNAHALVKVTEDGIDYWVLDTAADLIWLSGTDLDADNDASADFTDIAEKMAASYRLGADIVFDADETIVDWNNDGTVDANDAPGLLAIGIDTKFTGHFDGQYHAIQNAFQDASSIALFNQVKVATIEKLRLLDFDFTSDASLGGGIVGEATGDGNVFHQLWVEGSLDFSSSSQSAVFAGGVVGRMKKTTITECVAKVDYTGIVSATKGKKVGGLVGHDDGASTISDSYSVSTLDGGMEYIAGLIGKSVNNDGTLSITNCYTASTVSNVANANTFGSFAGELSSATVASCYWDASIQTEGVGAGDNAGDVTGLSTTDFASSSNFVGWDFTNIWEMSDVNGVQRPHLQWKEGGSFITANIGAVYFAQTHLSEPTEAYFTLVSDRKALIKAHITSPDQSVAPVVKAIVTVDGQATEIILSGPTNLPLSFDPDIYTIQHSYDDGSFTGMIPKELMKPGMTIEIIAATEHKSFDDLAIGAPTVLRMNYFKFACIYDEYRDNSQPNWKEEFQGRIPVSDLDPTIIKSFFPEICVEPKSGGPARRYDAADWDAGDNYNKGYRFAIQCASSLLEAAGTDGQDYGGHFLSYVGYGTLNSSTQVGGSYKACGKMGEIGYILHECGHALGMPHSNAGFYPYQAGTYGGIVQGKDWVGPNWGFSEWNEKFMGPQFQNDDGTWKMKRSPMGGGGEGDNEDWSHLKYYSDYEVWKMKKKLENHIVEWDAVEQKWGSWDTLTNAYTNYRENNGVQYSLGGRTDVYSVIINVNPPTAAGNFVYAPVGPYEAGVIRLFDPSNAQDRSEIQSVYSDHVGGFDYTLRITQGTKVTYSMLPIEHDASFDPLDKKYFTTHAVNVKESDGPVTKSELLLTPNAEQNGLPAQETIVESWEITSSSAKTVPSIKKGAEVDEASSESLFNVYPNPAISMLTIENAPLNATFSIVDMIGQVQNSGTIDGTSMILNVESYSKGIYLLRVGDMIRKIIIE
jgi:hypothetical protein